MPPQTPHWASSPDHVEMASAHDLDKIFLSLLGLHMAFSIYIVGRIYARGIVIPSIRIASFGTLPEYSIGNPA